MKRYRNMFVCLVALVICTSVGWAKEQIREVHMEVLPGLNILWTFKGGAVPVELNWSKQDKMAFRLGDPGGAALMGFEIIAFREFNIDSKNISEIDASAAKSKKSANGKALSTISASYGFGWDKSGKQIDMSSFEVMYRTEGEQEWRKLMKLPSEPQGIEISPDGSNIAFVIKGKASVISSNGSIIAEISGVDKVGFSNDSQSLFLLRAHGEATGLVQYDLARKSEREILRGKDIVDLAVSSTGKYVAYATNRAEVCVLDLPKGNMICGGVEGFQNPSLTFSPDGKTLALIKHRSICTINLENLFQKIEKGHTEVVQALIDKGVDVNAKTADGATALIMAAQEGHREVAQALIAQGADVNAKRTDGWTALMVAAEKGHPEIVQVLIAQGADVDAKAAYGWTAGWTALRSAAKEGHTEIARALIDKGADVNAKGTDGWTALMAAALNGHTEVVQALIDKGADVDAKDAYGRTALMFAARDGYPEIVQALIAQGADVNAKKTDSWTALMMAAYEGHPEIVQALIDKGADVDAKDAYGRTALMLAATFGHTDIVKLLRKAGAR